MRFHGLGVGYFGMGQFLKGWTGYYEMRLGYYGMGWVIIPWEHNAIGQGQLFQGVELQDGPVYYGMGQDIRGC